MIKIDLVERVYEKTGFSKKEASKAVMAFFELIKESLEKGEEVKLSGFGSFKVITKKAIKTLNPKTGAEIRISPKRTVIFKPSYILRQLINR
jgi:integration host factor subunit alpha